MIISKNRFAMLRTIVTPKKATINIPIPERYIGKVVEILLFLAEESEKPEKLQPRNIAQFKGFLTNEEASQYQQYLQTARKEWDRNI